MAVALMELALFCSKQMLFLKKTTKKTGFITYFAVLAFLLDVTNTHAILDYIHGALKSPKLQKTEAAFKNHTRLGDKLFVFT